MNTQEKRPYQKITERLYNVCKIMLNGGAKNKEISDYLNISENTVSRIRNSETFDEYKAIAYEQGRLYKKKKTAEEAALKKDLNGCGTVAVPSTNPPPDVPPKQIVEYRQSVTIQATHYMEAELKKHTELLTLISNKLAAIIEDLYGTKEAK